MPPALAPCVPHWVALEREARMQIDPGILNTVGFIGEPTGQGFDARGTCFLLRVVDEAEAFTYLITARHLVRPIKFRKETCPTTDPIYVRLPAEGGGTFVIPMTRGDWIPHKDNHVDLCVAEFDPRKWEAEKKLQITTLEYPSIAIDDQRATHFGFGIGSGIFIPSVFVGHEGELNNTPVVRLGNVAAMPAPIRRGSPTRPAYLIETHSIGGASGAPVFFHIDPFKNFGRSELPRDLTDPKTKISPYLLIGVLIGAHSGSYLADFVERDDEEQIISLNPDFNAGISIVVPIPVVIEILDQDEPRGRREAALESIGRRTGYRETSARSAPSTTADNPSHKEDFTALVSAAAKKRPQGGQT
jgi:hypothetical protein